MSVARFVVNGRAVEVRAHPMARLLDVLRIDLGLTGTKEGCGEGECGACTVLVDGEPVCACLVPLAQVERAEVTTVEGLAPDHPLPLAFAELGGAQCGICTPGMVMAAVGLGPEPTLEDVRTALAGNLCRCTGYQAIYRAVLRAAGREDAADSPPAAEVLPIAADGRADFAPDPGAAAGAGSPRPAGEDPAP